MDNNQEQSKGIKALEKENKELKDAIELLKFPADIGEDEDNCEIL